ncbi:WecB/TagA/CpsF family glycosyltransferase [Geodermatophilus sp. CPCC 205761]|uniref:WecB/TagA/CpsF family glycosyltransferase n=1 Tax=Geodermatophilus sp. CPCC 205761 TaxID=2936597 RepID=UPI003EEC532F
MVAVEPVRVGPFRVVDLAREQLAEALAQDWAEATRPIRVFALHVGGLNRWRDAGFVDLLGGAEWCYADGASVVLVARAAGAVDIQRAPTTDLAHAVLDLIAARAGGEATFALVGGPPGLAERAAQRLEAEHGARCVFTSDGFQEDWVPVLEGLKSVRPDVVFVGMGMPTEAQWVTAHIDHLAPGLVMTCGGWFGFLAGEESRAPAVLQRYGVEWLWRLLQAPRLLTRYVRGAVTTARLCLPAALGGPRRSAREARS